MSGSSNEMKTQVPCAAGLHMLKTPQQNSVESPLGINRGFHEELSALLSSMVTFPRALDVNTVLTDEIRDDLSAFPAFR